VRRWKWKRTGLGSPGGKGTFDLVNFLAMIAHLTTHKMYFITSHSVGRSDED
jgi:hypothetical protein